MFLFSCTSSWYISFQIEGKMPWSYIPLCRKCNPTPHNDISYCGEWCVCACLLHCNTFYSKSFFYFHAHRVHFYHSKLKGKYLDHSFTYVTNVIPLYRTIPCSTENDLYMSHSMEKELCMSILVLQYLLFNFTYQISYTGVLIITLFMMYLWPYNYLWRLWIDPQCTYCLTSKTYWDYSFNS